MGQNTWTKRMGTAAPWIMGVLNVTPDSFSDGGLYQEPSKAVAHAQQLIRDGAHIIDVGAESTRPGAVPVDVEVELHRLESLIPAVSSLAYVSVDTFHARTAARALSLGARMINDISALRADPEMRIVLAEFQCEVVLMYSKQPGSTPHATSDSHEYENVIATIGEFLRRQVDAALDAGIAEDKIILDPGMGTFISPSATYSWQVLGALERLVSELQPFPILVGTSRKGFLGGKLSERDPVSALTSALAVSKGAAFIRTHNVAAFKRVLNAS